MWFTSRNIPCRDLRMQMSEIILPSNHGRKRTRCDEFNYRFPEGENIFLECGVYFRNAMQPAEVAVYFRGSSMEYYFVASSGPFVRFRKASISRIRSFALSIRGPP